MVTNHLPPRVFGVLNGLLFVVILVTIILVRRRQQERDGHNGPVVGARRSARAMESHSAHRSSREQVEGATVDGQDSEEQGSEPAQIESALPSWTPQTPAHEVLGLSPNADRASVEKAYRTLLKRYHPDRFSSWGRGYQTRAHQIVLRIQAARDQMLKNK